jgi:hypothetical protein
MTVEKMTVVCRQNDCNKRIVDKMTVDEMTHCRKFMFMFILQLLSNEQEMKFAKLLTNFLPSF